MIVGIFGYAQHGKDTVGNYLRTDHRFQLDAFAKPIKDMLRVGLGLNAAQLFGGEKEVVDPRYERTPREMFQSLGTEWGRNMVHREVWIRALISRVQQLGGADVAVTDVRYTNEAQALKDLGARFVFVQRPGAPVNLQHSSEQGVVDLAAIFEHEVLLNDGTLDDLYRQTTALIADWRSRDARGGR